MKCAKSMPFFAVGFVHLKCYWSVQTERYSTTVSMDIILD